MQNKILNKPLDSTLPKDFPLFSFFFFFLNSCTFTTFLFPSLLVELRCQSWNVFVGSWEESCHYGFCLFPSTPIKCSVPSKPVCVSYCKGTVSPQACRTGGGGNLRLNLDINPHGFPFLPWDKPQKVWGSVCGTLGFHIKHRQAKPSSGDPSWATQEEKRQVSSCVPSIEGELFSILVQSLCGANEMTVFIPSLVSRNPLQLEAKGRKATAL